MRRSLHIRVTVHAREHAVNRILEVLAIDKKTYLFPVNFLVHARVAMASEALFIAGLVFGWLGSAKGRGWQS